MSKASPKPAMGVPASIAYMLSTVWKADRGAVVFSFYKQVSEEIFVAFFVVQFTRTFYDFIQRGVDFMEVVKLLILFCSLHILIHIASALHAWYIRIKTPEVYRHMFGRVMDKAQTMDIARYEEPEFYNRFSRALDEALTKTMDGLFSFTLALGEGLAVLVSIIIVSTIDPLLLCFLLPPVAAAFWLGGQRNRIQFALATAETPWKRSTEYAKRVFFEKKYAGEIRLYDIRNVLFRKHRENTARRYGISVEHLRKAFFAQWAQQVLMFCLMSASISLYITWVLKVQGSMAIGAYTAILVTAGYITWKSGDTVSKAIDAGKNCIFMNNLKDFLEDEKKPTENPSAGDGGASTPALAAPEPVPPGLRLGDLEFRNATFTYRGATAPVIRDLSFTVRQGERIALVGENGAGKTTLVKLLMGLYPLSGGSISMNGRHIGEWEGESYRARFATVFQDLQIFGLTLAENVLLRIPRDDQDRRKAEEALRLAQFGDTLDRLPRGIDTPVTREFDDSGFVCSGGQAQKIALARVFAKEPDIVILDEPSSALDPIAEFQLYQNMLAASQGRTVFFISHRLSSARLADRVLYLEDGQLAESGSHEALMARDGKYAALFRLQARNYREHHFDTVEGKALYGN